jgi:putative hydrolase of the HAD superfamily
MGLGIPEVLLFDVGNVLIEVDFARVTAAWAAVAGVPVERIAARFEADAAFRDHETGTLDDAGYFAHLRGRFGIALSDEDFRAGWNEVFVAPVAGMESVLRSLSTSYPLYGFSNTNRCHAAYFVPRYSAVIGHLRELFCSCELGWRKPDPRAYAEVVRRIGVPAGRIAFFDDLEENVEAARRAGMLAFPVRGAAGVHHALQRLGIDLSGNS